MRHLLQILVILAALTCAPVSAQPEFPKLSGRVVDNADILPADVEADLTAKLEALEKQSQRQLVIATVPDLQGYEIEEYGYQLGREWGIGDAERNDGAILLVAPNDRKVRIEVGYGLEGYLTDALSSLIIQNQILPRFRDGDMPGGVVAGTDALIGQLVLSPDEAARVANEAAAQQKADSEDGGFPVGALIWFGFIFFFFIMPILGAGKRRRKYRSKGKGPWGDRDDDDDDEGGGGWGRTARDIILWEVGSAIARGAMSGGSSGGSSWGGGGFGGGFSGGGGSFGGGGASGGW